MGISSFLEHRKHKIKEYDIPTTRITVNISDKIPRLPETMKYSEIKVMNLSMIFVDVKGYSKLVSEHRNSEVIARIMRIYIKEMVSAIRHFKGTIISIEGDGILAAFHSQSSDKDDSLQFAFYCAITMSSLLKEVINPRIQGFKQHPLRCRYAIDYGRVHITRVGVHGKGKNDLLYIGEPTSSVVKIQSKIPAGSIGVTKRVYNLFSRDIQGIQRRWWTGKAWHTIDSMFREEKRFFWKKKLSLRFGTIFYTNPEN